MVTISPAFKQPLWVSAVLAAVSLIVLAGIMGVISSEKKTVLNQKVALAGLKNDLTHLDTILTDKKQYGAAIGSVTRTLPKDYNEVASAVGTLEQVAKSTNLTGDLTIDDKPKPESNGLQSLSIVFHTTGSYSDINTFLTNVSLLPYHTRVDALQFDGTGGKITAVITIRLYMQ